MVDIDNADDRLLVLLFGCCKKFKQILPLSNLIARNLNNSSDRACNLCHGRSSPAL